MVTSRLVLRMNVLKHAIVVVGLVGCRIWHQLAANVAVTEAVAGSGDLSLKLSSMM